MPIYKDESRGTWYVSMRLPDPITGRSKKVVKRGFRTKKQASLWESKARAEGATAGTSIAFWEVFLECLNNSDAKGTTRQKKESWITMYFADLKDKPIQSIKKADLVKWRNQLKDSGLAVRTMNCGLQYVRGTFAFYSDVYGGQNVGSVLKSFKLSKQDKTEMEIWTPEEFNAFIENVERPVYKAYFSFLYWTGCRRCEGMGLTKDCFTGNLCHIYRSIKYYSDGFRPLKTDSSERTIRVDDELLEMLTPFIEQADPFVFGGVHPLCLRQIGVEFERGIKKSGVKPIRLHDLRHSHASLLLNNGTNVVAVSKRLGHSSPRTTWDTYCHLMQDTEDLMMETIEKIKKR